MQDLPNGGGGDPSIGSRALETLATPLVGLYYKVGISSSCIQSLCGDFHLFMQLGFRLPMLHLLPRIISS